MKKSYIAVILLILVGTFSGNAQQDPQYTQYMYNTQVVNPAYAGSRNVLSFGLLYRTQWVGLDGAPKTATLIADTPIGTLDNMGLGFSLVSEEIGPATETNITIDYSYSINVSFNSILSFGLKVGLDLLDVDFSKLNLPGGTIPDDPYFNDNIDNKLEPQIGMGVYFNTERFYAGLSVPNFLTTKHFDSSVIDNPNVDINVTEASERMHYFLIAGYVFDLGENLKFKPATLVKAVSGSPLQVDLSANFLIYEKVTLGAAYRWDAALSAMAGFQVSDSIFMGFGYDFETTELQKYNDGSYEFMLRFDVFNNQKVLTPRFF